MFSLSTLIGKTKPFLIALLIVAGVAVAARIVFADEAPPAEVSASQHWLQQNVPEIKTLQARLATLQAEKDKRVQVIETFGYQVNWNTLTAEKSPLPTE